MNVETAAGVKRSESHDGLQPSFDEDDMDVGEVSAGVRRPARARARRRAGHCWLPD